MSQPAPRALALVVAALCAIACSRRSAHAGYGLVQSAIAVPVPASEMESSSRVQPPPPALAPPAPSGPRGPLGRKPVPIEIDGVSVPGEFARVAPPSPDHPRGTLAVFRPVFVPAHPPSLGGDGADDVELAEVDLATASPIRRVFLGHGIETYDMADGATGPVLFVQTSKELTLMWADAAFSIVARRSVPALGKRNVQLCAFAAVGDRAVLADCGGEKADRTQVWVLDARSETVQRSCPGRSVNSLIEITPWRGRALVTGIATHSSTDQRACAFRVDGRGDIATGSYPFQDRVFPRDGELYVRSSMEDFHLVGDDLRPTRQTVPDPRSPDVVAAEALRGYASRLTARLVEGTIVLRAHLCCGEYGPHLYLFDPHADD